MYHHNAGCSHEARDRSDVADEIEIEVVVERRVDCVSGANQEKRVAIRRRAYDRLSADIAVRARPVLDDELLAEPLREPLTHQARGDVVTATGGVSNNPAHRPRWIGLRESEARHARECGSSARCQMQECAAGKFHSITSLARASKAGCQLVLRFFRCASWGVRDDTASAALAVRFAPIHPFATGRVEGIPIPFVRPVAERIAKPWSFRLERRQA